MTPEQIQKIAFAHSHKFGKFDSLVEPYKELSAYNLGREIFHAIGKDPNYLIENFNWRLNFDENAFEKDGMIFGYFTALGYENLILFMTNPKEYITKFPEFYQNNEIKHFLLKFADYYSINIEE